MNKFRLMLAKHWPLAYVGLGLSALLSSLFLYRLGTLPGSGLSPSELNVLRTPIGWHGIINDPLNWPLQIGRSIGRVVDSSPGALSLRLPSAIIGAVAVAAFILLVRAWSQWRAALLASLLFATSAWTLHVSRYASDDVLYLLAIPLLLLTRQLLLRSINSYRLGLVLLIWGVLLYIPGVVWLVALTVFWLRRDLLATWRNSRAAEQVSLVIASLAWVPLLGYSFYQAPASLSRWLGAPAVWNLGDIGQRLIAVPYHLFVHAPAIPELWLGRLPLLDIFTLSVTSIGLILYLRQWRATRSRLVTSYLVVGSLVVGIGGVATFSLVYPLLFLAAAYGIDCLLRDWLKTFPVNPVARGLGISLITLAVVVSSLYNLRSYFVAWPHAAATRANFSQHP